MVSARSRPPEGPFWFPIDCSSTQGIDPVFGQLGSFELAGSIPVAFAHTRLVSKPCQVTLPLKEGGSLSMGFSLMLVKWVMIWTNWPKTMENRVASGRAGLTAQEVAPVVVGRQV